MKISSPPAKRSASTKFREMLAARRLETKWPKQRILTAYLNRLDYGNLRIGAAEAARFYFPETPRRSLARRVRPARRPAPGAVPPQSPAPPGARHRAPQHRSPDASPPSAKPIPPASPTPSPNPSISARSGKPNPPHGSQPNSHPPAPLHHPPVHHPPSSPSHLPTSLPPTDHISYLKYEIRTTLDLTIQQDIEAIVREETSKLRSANLRHAAVVVIDNPTGEILALVSSADWQDPRGGQLNGALAAPLARLRAQALHLSARDGAKPASHPRLHPRRHPQPLPHARKASTCRKTTIAPTAAPSPCAARSPARSMSPPCANSTRSAAPRRFTNCSSTLGLTTLGEDSAAYGLGLTIGNAPVRLLELTNAYATLARGGRHPPASPLPGSAARTAGIPPAVFRHTPSI